MSERPENSFITASGQLGQRIFENPGTGLAPRLEFFIEIAFKPFVLDDEAFSPILRLNGILAEVKKWSDLGGQTLKFPYHPKPGSIDAAVLLFRAQNPAEVTSLNFGKVTEDSKLPVSFDTVVDFEIEADSDLGQVPMTITCQLAVTPLKVATSLEKRYKSDPEAITQAVADLIDLSAYGPLMKVPGGFEFPIK